MSTIYIAGIAMTVFGRHLERGLDDLAREALDGALADAGCTRAELAMAFYAGVTNGPLQGQHSIPGQVVFSKIGIEGIPVYNIENACASGSSAFNLAVQCLKAGTTDVALALGAEKMNIPDKLKALALFESGWDVSCAEANYRNLIKMGEGVVPPPGSESDKPYSKFMAIYAALCRHHMKTHGTTQRQIAAVSAKNSVHGSLNPKAQYRDVISVQEVLAAREVSWPLTLPMCSPIGDGAAAAVIVSERKRRGLGIARAVTVERPAPPDHADLLPPAVGRYTRRFVYGEDERHLSFEQGGGHHGSHPHLVHEFVRSIVGRGRPRVDAGMQVEIHITFIISGVLILPELRLRQKKRVGPVKQIDRSQNPDRQKRPVPGLLVVIVFSLELALRRT